MTSYFNNPKAPLVAFLILAVAVAYLFVRVQTRSDTAVYEGQIRACQRLNDVVVESNDRIPKLRLTADVLRQFLSDAAKARAAGSTELDKKTAKRYRNSARELDNLRFDFVQSIDCKRAIPRP